MKRSILFTCMLLGLLMVHTYASAMVIDLITNGDFETGTIAGWNQISPVSPLEWGIASGASVGGEYIHSSDNSFFATPWAKGPNPSPVALAQRVDISPYSAILAAPYVNVGADMIYSDDGIKAEVKFYNSGLSLLSSTSFGEYKHLPITSANVPNGYIANINTALSIPGNTRYIDFIAYGYKHEGSYIDSGFDNVSLKLTTVPEPASIFLLGGGLLGLVRSGKRKKTYGIIS